MSQKSENAVGIFDIDNFEIGVDVTEVVADTYQCTSFSNATAFDTAEGLVLIDTGYAPLSQQMAAALREHTDSPVHTAIYTHGHIDHAFGLDEFLVEGQDQPNVIAHEAMADRFDRYALTKEYNETINGRQFSADPEAVEYHSLWEDDVFGWPDHPPTTTYDDDLTITVGDTIFELHHSRGETDDHTWVFCPDREVLCSGDLVTASAPNAGNPQKVQRYPWEWVDALREMAALDARTLLSGHGRPIVDDPEEIEHRLLRYAEYLDTIVERTIEALNDGAPPHVDIVREIDLPDPDESWLQSEYDSGEFIARNVIRYYGGWWTGRPSELKPASRSAVAEEIADLAGDAKTLAERAEELMDAGDKRLACHLADYALEADPDNETVHAVVADIYDERAASSEDMMSANIFASMVKYANEGRTFR
ncbi:MBL fold metallo-hydrolase (plasmid) [Haloferax mediterranei ATCC 33500]|uniref:Alkyl sulfatase-like hydrolase n=1 Tax=Haloferax mediterranei (strain ATCC 33500 / DSM 1411 / JCM 8866 / NBRC 14739 / NCIMB 2177 / R-4) TaxID=523841 RepID=I3R910_HALMT|nr:alkyl sulfatase dimerization domain-containing protein [Haloferax mediterranei]AFK20720.1 alkyl sulfatase-like hydrolase [Haloferax mediterranei ATCC 33500]AHZ24024.1 beta-lactamase [Haloferax mediterranei ATCC 33500]ELZ97610.1 alkyl sulfatase-like hydrolase [Haloferax mediterranei ATCC 33500]MDX5989697.1 alkyl sulfatase dimerization domain-containing protein [Haloferax mediterranei ATCC 33500]QCQ77403.1 MBL fold metallo-hydrolase [Haloferax mediterranei ATCC 33500]